MILILAMFSKQKSSLEMFMGISDLYRVLLSFQN